MKTVATIEARMTSSRLPGKVLLPAAGVPMLKHLVTRLRAVPSIKAIVLATTENETDDPLADFALQEGIECYRGSEDDVMLRVIGAAESIQADVVVEITGDCPIIDPQIIEQTIRMFEKNDADYVSNAPIAKKAKDFGLEGFGNNWKHNTMTSEEASIVKLDIFNNITNCVYLDSDSGLWYLAYLRDQGYDWNRIENSQRIIVDMLRRDNQNKHSEKDDLLEAFAESIMATSV